MQASILQQLSANAKFKAAGLRAALATVFAWLMLGIMLEDLLFSLLVAIVFGTAVLGLLLYYPKMQAKKHAMVIESQLPFALMNIAVELNLGLRFEDILEHVANQGNEVGKEFGKVLVEVREQGASVQGALMHFAERTDSLQVKRAVALFVSVYEQGKEAGGAGVKMLARELLAKQRAESKEFSGRLVVYSLLFIAVSAVVPALFQSFAIVGSMVLNFSMTSVQIFLIIVVVFPAIDLIALYYIRAKTPVFLRG